MQWTEAGMSEMELDPGVQRIGFIEPFVALFLVALLLFVPVLLGHPVLATIAWVAVLALSGLAYLWVHRDMDSLRADHDFTMRTWNYQRAAKPLRMRIATGFSNFVAALVFSATLPVYLILALFGVAFQSRVKRAASGGLSLFVSGTVVSALCILGMSILLYVFRLDTHYWLGTYWMPAVLNLAAFFWLLHAVLRPVAVSEAWRISAWPSWLMLGTIVVASIVFGALLNLDLTRRLGLSHGSLADLADLLPRFLHLPELTDVAELLEQAATGKLLHESAGHTLLNLQWTAFGVLLALTSFELIWKVFSAQRGENELLTIANLQMSMGDIAAARDVAETQMTEKMISRHDLLAQVAAVEADMDTYWAQLQAFAERRFYDLFQNQKPYLLHWLTENHISIFGKAPEIFFRIRESRRSFLDDSPVVLFCMLRDVLVAPGTPDFPLGSVIGGLLLECDKRADRSAKVQAFVGAVAGLKGADEALATPAFVPEGSDADEARAWQGLHVVFGLLADRLSHRPEEEITDPALRAGEHLTALYDAVENPVVKYFYFHILQYAVEQPVGPAGMAMSARFNPAIRKGAAEAGRRLARYVE